MPTQIKQDPEVRMRLLKQYRNDLVVQKIFPEMRLRIINHSWPKMVLKDGKFMSDIDNYTKKALAKVDEMQKDYLDTHYSELFND